MSLSRLLVAGLLAGPAVLPAQDRATRYPTVATTRDAMVIEHATVLTMASSVPLVDHSVLWRHGEIVDVAPTARLEVPAGATRIDGRGKFVMPGLVDGHTHTLVPTDFALYLASGVTTVVEMSGSPAALRFRQELRDGTRLGPRLFVSGPQLKVAALAFNDREVEVGSVEAARRVVRHCAAQGYDFVKVWGRLAPPIYAAVCEEAKRCKIRVTGHIPKDVGLEASLAAGQESVAHLEEYWNKFVKGSADRSRLDAAVELTRRAGVPVVTTLSTYENIIWLLTAEPSVQLARHRKGVVDWGRLQAWTSADNEYRKRFSRARVGGFRAGLVFQKQLAHALVKAGVPLIAGTDAGGLSLSLHPGASLVRELELLVEAGLTPYQALSTATSNATRWLTGNAGVLASRSRADLIVLDADPTQDIGNLRRIAGVVQAGTYRDRAALGELIASTRRLLDATNRRIEILITEGGGAAFDPADHSAYDPFAMSLAAVLLARGGRIEPAMAALQRTAKDFPKLYDPVFVLGAFALKMKNRPVAAAQFSKVLELCPGHLQAAAFLERK